MTRRTKGLGLSAVLVGLGVIVIGTPLHWLYEFSGRAGWAALISPVNESAWEHYKLFFWPLLMLAAVEYPLVRSQAPSYGAAKLASAPAAFAAMSLAYYLPTALWGGSMVISIGSFCVGVIAAQAAYLSVATRPGTRVTEGAALAGLVFLAALFVLFTWVPPHLWLWLDVKGQFWGVTPP